MHSLIHASLCFLVVTLSQKWVSCETYGDQHCTNRGEYQGECSNICDRQNNVCMQMIKLSKCSCSGYSSKLEESVVFNLDTGLPESPTGFGHLTKCPPCTDTCRNRHQQQNTFSRSSSAGRYHLSPYVRGAADTNVLLGDSIPQKSDVFTEVFDKCENNVPIATIVKKRYPYMRASNTLIQPAWHHQQQLPHAHSSSNIPVLRSPYHGNTLADGRRSSIGSTCSDIGNVTRVCTEVCPSSSPLSMSYYPTMPEAASSCTMKVVTDACTCSGTSVHVELQAQYDMKTRQVIGGSASSRINPHLAACGDCVDFCRYRPGEAKTHRLNTLLQSCPVVGNLSSVDQSGGSDKNERRDDDSNTDEEETIRFRQQSRSPSLS